MENEDIDMGKALDHVSNCPKCRKIYLDLKHRDLERFILEWFELHFREIGFPEEGIPPRTEEVKERFLSRFKCFRKKEEDTKR